MARLLVHSANPREAFTSPFVWAAMLISVLVLGVVLGFLVMRRQQRSRSSGSWLQGYAFKPVAMLIEACVPELRERLENISAEEALQVLHAWRHLRCARY